MAIAGRQPVTCLQGGERNWAEATPGPSKDSGGRDPPKEWERRPNADPFNCVVRNRL